MSTDFDKKQCRCCGEIKNIDMFYVHKGMKSGRLNKCKDCKKSYGKEYLLNEENRQRRLDFFRNYSRTEKGKQVQKRAKKKWFSTERGAKYRERDNGRTKSLGRDKVYRLVRRLEKQPCERCGRIDFVHAHHDDYSKPLDVIWLCPVHHKERHKELANAS